MRRKVRAVNCPDCEGWGRREYDKPVVDYVNGGYIDVVWGICDSCEGSGDIEEEEEDEE
jgi:DnaJ-class molecular chaperone